MGQQNQPYEAKNLHRSWTRRKESGLTGDEGSRQGGRHRHGVGEERWRNERPWPSSLFTGRAMKVNLDSSKNILTTEAEKINQIRS